jgi:SAM-dependent methyltransferase
MSDFYDRMAGLYHLIFENWDASIERQAEQLTGILRDRWGTSTLSILDVSCGIGTQAIGLAKRGFIVTASDQSAGAIARAKTEATRRGVAIDFSVCDMRAAYVFHRRHFDVVVHFRIHIRRFRRKLTQPGTDRVGDYFGGVCAVISDSGTVGVVPSSSSLEASTGKLSR